MTSIKCEKCKSTDFKRLVSKISGVLFGVRTTKYICNSCGYSKYIEEKEIKLK